MSKTQLGVPAEDPSRTKQQQPQSLQSAKVSIISHIQYTAQIT